MIATAAIGLLASAVGAKIQSLSCAGDLSFPDDAGACRAYTGSAWTREMAAADCGSVPGASGGQLTDEACAIDATVVGTCVVSEGEPMQNELYFYGGDASALSTMCSIFLRGEWSAGSPSPSEPPNNADILLDEALEALVSDGSVSVVPDSCSSVCVTSLALTSGAIEFTPACGKPDVGLLYMPGGLVDPRAYSVFARAIAAEGYFSAIIPFPGNLAIIDPFRPTAIISRHREIRAWVLAGHSLGGSAAAIYASSDPHPKLNALALYASYASDGSDLSESGLSVLDITASEDGVMNRAAWEEALVRLPQNSTTFLEVVGGNHEQFGYYIRPDGVDGVATVTREFQHDFIIDATLKLLGSL